MTEGSLTRAALVEEVADVADLTKKHAEIIVETVFRNIVESLHRGEKVELRGFGSFRLRRREPHRGRNPKTGDPVDVPSKRVAYFSPGKELKELINPEPATAGPAVHSSSAPMSDAGTPQQQHGQSSRMMESEREGIGRERRDRRTSERATKAVRTVNRDDRAEDQGHERAAGKTAGS